MMTEPTRNEASQNNTMFFMRLRTQAKWVFLLLALAFGIGFVAFGVGTGSGGVADILGGVFGAVGNATPSLNDAQDRVSDNPNDPDAHLALARAHQAVQQLPEAAEAYEQAIALRPDDTAALRSLSGVYQTKVSILFNQAQMIEAAAIEANPQSFVLFNPSATAFQIELSNQAIASALSEGLTATARDAYDEVAIASVPWLESLQRLAALEPASQTLQLQVAQAAEFADQPEVAAAAYLRALEIDPDGPQAPVLRQNLRRLGFVVPGDAQTDADLIAQAQNNARGNQDSAIFEQPPAPAGSETPGG